MAKQVEDSKTIDMLGLKRGRGRPPADHQRTEAERKADQRARRKAEGGTVPVTFDLTPELIDALDAYLQNYREVIGPQTKSQAVERMLRNQVMRKR